MEWFVDWFAATDHELSRFVLQRGVAAIFFIAFLSSLNQFPALCGDRGLLPARRVLEARRYARPTLFRFGYSDRVLRIVCVAGMLLAASVVVGLPQAGPPWVPAVVFLTMWALYMSIANVGQTFYGFGWEMLLLEAGFIVAWLGSDAAPPPAPILLLVVWLVFRLEFGAGMIKMRGDRSWRDLTALYYHHETQPMPGPLSRQAHLLPKWVHRGEVLGNHVAQLVVPFLLFLPQPIASIGAVVVIVTQLWLVVTGNFAWLNWITIVLVFAAVSDSFVHAIVPWVPLEWGARDDIPVWWVVPVLAVTALFVVLSWWPLKNLFARHQLMNASFNRWGLANAYGAFGSVTKRRIELIIEGTRDPDPYDAVWTEYEFKGKPGDVRRIPRQWAPYHLRLDWLMWFLPLGSVHEEWFHVLLGRLLEADRATLRLLARDPFDGEAPTWVRVVAYRYRFATREEYRAHAVRWMRDSRREVIPPIGGA